MINWIKSVIAGEFQALLDVILGIFMLFCVAMIGEIGKVGDWLFKKKR